MSPKNKKARTKSPIGDDFMKMDGNVSEGSSMDSNEIQVFSKLDFYNRKVDLEKAQLKELQEKQKAELKELQEKLKETTKARTETKKLVNTKYKDKEAQVKFEQIVEGMFEYCMFY